jgi:hypothetical protein
MPEKLSRQAKCPFGANEELTEEVARLSLQLLGGFFTASCELGTIRTDTAALRKTIALVAR